MSSIYQFARKVYKKENFKYSHIRVCDVEKIIKSFLDEFECELFEKGKVSLNEKFSIRKMENKERVIYNISTKTKEKRIVTRFVFRPSKRWKEIAKGK